MKGEKKLLQHFETSVSVHINFAKQKKIERKESSQLNRTQLTNQFHLDEKKIQSKATHVFT